MKVIEGKYKCRLCDDIFDANSKEYSKCKCGESEIKPSSFGYSYKNGNQVDTIEQIEYYLENDFVKLPQDILDILAEYDKLKEKLEYQFTYYKWYKEGKNGEKYLSDIRISYSERLNRYSSERNEIKLNISFEKNKYKGNEKTKERLFKFLNIINDIVEGKFDLTNRSKMVDWSEKEDIYYREESTEEYDYTFYF